MVEQPSIPSGYEFHHIGYATASIERERSFFELLGYRIEGSVFADPQQGVIGCFMIGSGPRIELLENSPGSNTLTPWLNAGIKMYHFAYWVNRIDQALDWARGQRARIWFRRCRPLPSAVAKSLLWFFVTDLCWNSSSGILNSERR